MVKYDLYKVKYFSQKVWKPAPNLNLLYITDISNGNTTDHRALPCK